MSFTGLVIVAAVAFMAPLLLGLVPKVRLPAIVLEILAGIAIGPAGLGIVQMDPPIQVGRVIGLSFLLFLAGLELEVKLLRGRRLRLTLASFALSVAIAYAIGLAMQSAGMVRSPLLVAIILSGTALGIVAPVLKDAGELTTEFGQTVFAGSTIAEFGTILLLSLLFSREASDPTTKLVLAGGFVVLTIVLVVAMTMAEKSTRIGEAMLRLQDTTAQIRIRGAFLLLAAFAALASRLGLEAILGAFVAGALLAVLDPDYKKTHPKFHDKLEAIGFGVFIPVFFVSSGIQFDLQALLAVSSTVARLPLFLIALVVARGLSALVYRPMMSGPQLVVTALLQSTSLPFIVVATSIGVVLGLMPKAIASALVAAGVLSVVIFPMIALLLLRRAAPQPVPVRAST
jgi:Kef-type K+ transport system membrane component KefB